MLIASYREQDHNKLVEIWERAVRATHTFLEEHHIEFYKKVVSDVLQQRQVEVWEALNAGAARFYEKMGFVQMGRSELDGSGNPFPLLHLEIKADQAAR
ncbi:hypothetical protein SAMN05518856_10534 [Paenibacillus sp. OK003]|nr:hypothetical protein SAMN05518856_10534 [Paenibacillus sp. OK003]